MAGRRQGAASPAASTWPAHLLSISACSRLCAWPWPLQILGRKASTRLSTSRTALVMAMEVATGPAWLSTPVAGRTTSTGLARLPSSEVESSRPTLHMGCCSQRCSRLTWPLPPRMMARRCSSGRKDAARGKRTMVQGSGAAGTETGSDAGFSPRRPHDPTWPTRLVSCAAAFSGSSRGSWSLARPGLPTHSWPKPLLGNGWHARSGPCLRECLGQAQAAGLSARHCLSIPAWPLPEQ
mmetsp:Transcript_82254/g.266612  ORF Transcript_82254/g.266612 Transcript_82254/m.266612 type:complete len:238 (+) Transcript_82254:285-998(+)